MFDKYNGGLLRRTIVTALVGALTAILVARFVINYLQQAEARIDLALLVVGSLLVVALAIQLAHKDRTGAKRDASDSTNYKLEKGLTAIAIGLLLFTSMLSGPYLVLVPLISIALIVIYIIRKLRQL